MHNAVVALDFAFSLSLFFDEATDNHTDSQDNAEVDEIRDRQQ